MKIHRRTYQRDSVISHFRMSQDLSLPLSRIRSRAAFLSISPARKHPRHVLYHEPRCTSKDRVSWKIARPFVKCKIRNTSPQKWNKPRHTGWYHWRRSTGGSNRNGGVDRGWRGGWVDGPEVGGTVYGYVSHLSAQILLWLYAAGARNFTYVQTFVPSRYNIRT